MHNKSIWLIIEDVWSLFAFIVGQCNFYSSSKGSSEHTEGDQGGGLVSLWERDRIPVFPHNLRGFITDAA